LGKIYAKDKIDSIRKSITVQSKSSKDSQSFGENSYSASEMQQKSKIFPRKKTESITFRLESEILDCLRHEAKIKDVSINTLVSQTVKQHTNWHSIAPQAGFIYVRRRFIIKLLESQNDEQIESLAKHVPLSSNKDFILMLRRKYNIHSALDLIETWIRVSGYPYTHNLEYLDYSHKLYSFILQHHMGRKWSLYLAELFKNWFEEFGVRNPQFDMTDSALTFEIVVPIEEDHLHRDSGIDYRR
jgi:predicted HicB family RNase H-like nuclease